MFISRAAPAVDFDALLMLIAFHFWIAACTSSALFPEDRLFCQQFSLIIWLFKSPSHCSVLDFETHRKDFKT